METLTLLNNFVGEDCGCCVDESNAAYGCAEKKAVFTHREQAVLGRIREASERARNIKRELKIFTEGIVSPEEKEKALLELEQLRQLRLQLEAERIAAAEERMRLLGHA